MTYCSWFKHSQCRSPESLAQYLAFIMWNHPGACRQFKPTDYDKVFYSAVL